MQKLCINTELQSFDYDCEMCTSTSSKGTLNPSRYNPSILTKFISKKTLRGRKEKSPLPKGKKKCSICLEFDEYSKEPLISCSICKCTFHLNCYHIQLDKNEINYSSFKCERCTNSQKENISINSYKCFICGCNDGVLCHNKTNNSYYHYLCYRLLPELFEESKNESEISKFRIRKWRYKSSCRYCNEHISKDKVVIKCGNTKCKNYYHIPCAIEKGMLFSINFLYKYYCFEEFKDKISIPFYCASHNKRPAHSYRLNVINNENFDPNNIRCEEFTIYPKKSNKNNKIRILLEDIDDDNNNNNNNNKNEKNEKENEVFKLNCFEDDKNLNSNYDNNICLEEGFLGNYYKNDFDSIFGFGQNDDDENLFLMNNNL